MNARHYQPDAQLDRVVELFHADRAAWDRLPADLRSQTGVYLDFKESYSAAVRAGVIPADRGPVA